MDKFRRFIGILLILIGVSIIGTVVYKKMVTSNKQNEVLESFENQLKEDMVHDQMTLKEYIDPFTGSKQ